MANESQSLERTISKHSGIDTVTVLPTDTLPNGFDLSTTRPPIDYSSPLALARSTWARFLSLWTPRFCLSLLAGQVVSLCITCTNVTTTELVNRNWALSTTQTWFLLVLIFLVSGVIIMSFYKILLTFCDLYSIHHLPMCVIWPGSFFSYR